MLKSRYDDHSNAGRNDGFAVPCMLRRFSLTGTNERGIALPSAKRPRTSRLDVDLPPFGEGAPFEEFHDFGSGAVGFDGMQGDGTTNSSIVDGLSIIFKAVTSTYP